MQIDFDTQTILASPVQRSVPHQSMNKVMDEIKSSLDEILPRNTLKERFTSPSFDSPETDW